MKKFLLPACIALIAISSCNTEKGEIPTTQINSFPATVELEGRAIQYDPVNGIVGAIKTYGDVYRFITVGADNWIMLTDTAFNIIGYTAHNGEGPNDVLGVSCIGGKSLDKNGKPVVYDPSGYRFYSMDSTYNLVPKFDFSKANLHPLGVLELPSGDYLCIKEDYTYGLVKYDVSGDSIVNWPLGINFSNPTESNYDVTFMHSVDYSPAHNLIGEIYNGLGKVIFHNEDGDVVQILSVGDDVRISDITHDSPRNITNIVMTDANIYLLFDDEPNDACRVYVVDYDYNPVVEMVIPYAQVIDIDVTNRRIIAVNALSEEQNIMVYDLPECIVNP